MIHKLDRWHKTKGGLLVFAILELGLAYLFVSLAIDRGNLFYYALSLILFVGTLKNLFRFIGSFINGKRQNR
jgi:hypothetical protein